VSTGTYIRFNPQVTCWAVRYRDRSLSAGICRLHVVIESCIKPGFDLNTETTLCTVP